MTVGGWRSQEQHHGRHRRGAAGAMWTPAVRPTESAPAHARYDGTPAPPVWPTSEAPRRPGRPADEPAVPRARSAADAPAWPAPRHRAPDWPATVSSRSSSRSSSRGRAGDAPPSFLREPIVAAEVPAPLRRARHAANPVASPDMLVDTVPMSLPPKHGKVDGGPLSSAVVYPLPEAPVTGLRKFDLGTVPASVTPPRTWRKAAWFAVGTSAAVVLGLTVATSELVSRPVSDESLIDALPAYPTGPLTLGELPHPDETSERPSTDRPTTSGERSTTDTPSSTTSDSPARDTVIGSTSGGESVVPTEPPSEDTTSGTSATPPQPDRETVGRAPVTPTDPQEMGDRTEEYFALVTSDPAAASALTTGSMAREGQEGIEERYGDVERIEVQSITINRNEAVTTSRMKVVHKDGRETIEERQLTFTWGGDPKITDDATTG
ncbi:hypothetical protein [Actinophytocola sp. NPDC049390]|uniref:hypothetical protein n=1 Tax=Actinophytocola sp. NPDC049390 TaxID=3363894 RepID=UPI0037875882